MPLESTAPLESTGLEDAVASRRGLLHGLAAAGALGVGATGAGLVLTGVPGADSAAALSRRPHKHRRKHKHRHRHRHKVTPTPTPTPAPTIAPSTAPTAGPVVTPQPASTVTPRPLTAPAMLDDPFSRQIASRFSYGLTPELSVKVQEAGGGLAWFEQQLDPSGADYPADPDADALLSWWPSLTLDPFSLWQREKAQTERGWQVMQNYQRWLLLRSVMTQRSVFELMTDFWENHLHVPVLGDSLYTWRFHYGQTIRRYALGRFDQMLTAAITHPAMLLYLNAAVSTKAHPNENLGRELLELHTVGRGLYSEDDVKNSARILTGWHVDIGKTWAASYQSADHYVGQVDVMGFSDANASADGTAVTDRYLTYLAHHPATASRIARKLAVRFVSDDPSDVLVDNLAAVYLANDTDIVPVLLALVASPEFVAAAGLKVRTPAEDVAATYRSLGVVVSAPTMPISDYHVATQVLWQASALGAMPHNWPQPNGAPTDNASWSSPSRMMGSLGVHWAMGNAGWPSEGAIYRKPSDWLPTPTIRLNDLIEHLAQQLMVQHADQRLIDACCQAVSLPETEMITASHKLVRWNFGRLLSTLLDSPSQMTR